MIAAFIHPDGQLTVLSGELTADHASIAALGHAVYAAGNELAVRVGPAPIHGITLRGESRSLTLQPIERGVLLMEHEKDIPADVLQALIAEWQTKPVQAPIAPVTSVPTMSLSDALHATAP